MGGKAYDSHLKGVWQSMKMNNATSGKNTGSAGSARASQPGASRSLAMSGGQISSGAVLPNEAASVYQEQPVASPIQPAKLKSTQIASKKMIAKTNYPAVVNQVQRNVSGHGRKRVNYQGQISKGNHRVTTTSREPPKLSGPATAPDGYQSYRATQNRLMSSNQDQLLASLRGNAHQSFENISPPPRTGQRTGRQLEAYNRAGGPGLQHSGASLHHQTIVQSYNDFKNVLQPADSLSPNRIQYSGVAMQGGDQSFQSSKRNDVQQNQGSTPGPKKASRSKQLQIQLKSLYSQKYQEDGAGERDGPGAPAKTTVAGRLQQQPGRQ